MIYYKSTRPYKSGQKTIYRLSRSKIELFMQCQRCFWLDVRYKITRPSTPPFNINKAIDELFKKEFDIYRTKQEPHPLMKKSKIEAIPYKHTKINKWRQALGDNAGIDFIDSSTNLQIFGAVDDIWINKKEELIVVDYKSTAKNKPVISLGPEGTWYDMYRRQMEIYQWLFKQNNFKVSDIGYFVYATASTAPDRFDNLIQFETHIFPHKGNTDWVNKTLLDIKKTMDQDIIPPVGQSAMGGVCDYCTYARRRTELTLNHLSKESS